jgi:hypothetical protein
MQMLKDAVTFGGPVTVALGALRMTVDAGQHFWSLGIVVALVAALALVVGLRCPGVLRTRRTRRRRPASAALGRLAGPWRQGKAAGVAAPASHEERAAA